MSDEIDGLSEFWKQHEGWSIETELLPASRRIVKATIKNEVGRVIVTAHYSSGDEVMHVEKMAIERAINLLP